MTIRSKLYLTLFATVILVTSVLLLFLQYSVDTFDSYVQEIDAGMMTQFAELIEEEYEANGGEDWSFIASDLSDWLHRNQIFQRRRPFPNFDPRNTPPNFNPNTPPIRRGESFPQRGRNARPPFPPPGFADNQDFQPPESIESRLVLRDSLGQYIVGSTEDTEPLQKVNLVIDDDIIGWIELLPSGNSNRFPAIFSSPFTATPFPQGASTYNNDFVSRTRFMTVQARIFVILVFISIAVILLLGLPLARHFTRRVDTIYNAANKLSQGDFSIRITSQGKDELAKLADKFNYLADVLQKNKESQQQWVSNISHELRTPLGILKGEMEAIQDGLREADETQIDMLYNEVIQLSMLVDDLFELSMSDLGGLGYKKQNVGLLQIIEDSIERFRDQLENKNLKLTKSFGNSSDVQIFSDPQRLLQLLSNLLQNSINYTEKGGSINIQLDSTVDIVHIRIKDSSPGVSDDQLDHLFDRFFRVEQSRNRTTGGAGLGLSICKSITEAHQGTIMASHSSLGGVTISLTFPLAK
ncbi:MAG: hypothetical protein COA96_04610 [SAR86 cluster bacterium]|uniref:histidine kinase n=1 Tax=SAR86 cluster bacterium TaxID=2030880 RepID=A0A2A5B6D6_9GAMM|nr:MAG: hypothetical protein COA96_04610 [SAR86 cluster bacterium]